MFRSSALFIALSTLLCVAACSGHDDNREDDGEGAASAGGAATTTGSGGGGGGAAGPATSGSGGGGGAGVGGTAGSGTTGGAGAGGAGTGGAGAGGAGTGGAGGGSGTGGGGGGVTSTPCLTGPGWTLWRLSWGPNSGGYATVDAWDNGCTYSLANQACSLSGEPHDDANFGPGVVFNSSTDYFRVRYSVQGLSFTTATLYLGAHADGSGLPQGLLQSPIYGDLTFSLAVPISQHQTVAIDWSGYLSPSDDPNLTAVTLKSTPIGLAVSFMELCVQ